MVSAAPVEHSSWLRWLPGWQVLRHYQRSWLRQDVAAGLVLTAMLVPVGLAYAEASGLPGEGHGRGTGPLDQGEEQAGVCRIDVVLVAHNAHLHHEQLACECADCSTFLGKVVQICHAVI